MSEPEIKGCRIMTHEDFMEKLNEHVEIMKRQTTEIQNLKHRLGDQN